MGVPAKDTRFLRKLYLILKEEDADVVSWSEDGRAFAILDTARFQRVIKSKYHLSSLCTFRQNLHAHGFSEIEQSVSADKNTTNDAMIDSKANVKNPAVQAIVSDIPETYFHPFFVRGYPEFLEKISFDPSVKFRCQECKRQPNDAGTKCTFRKNSFRTTRAEAAIAILANAGAVVSSAGLSSPVRHAAPVAQNSVTTGPPASRSPLMVHVGGPRHQQQQRETNDTAVKKPEQKQPNAPSVNLSLSFAGAFLRPSVASLSSEHSGGQQQTASASAEHPTRPAPPSPQPVNAKNKPNAGSLMVRLSFGRKDESRSEGAAHADLMAELAARVAQKPLTSTNGKSGGTKSAPVSSNPATSAGKSMTSKPKASRKAASPAAPKPVAAMSLKRISPSPSEPDTSGDDQRRPDSFSASNQVKIAAFPPPIYSHSTAAYSNLYPRAPQPPTNSNRFSLSKEAASSVTPPSSSAFTPWSSNQGSRSNEAFSTVSRFEHSNPQVPRNDLLQRGNGITSSTEQALATQNFASVKAALSQAQARFSQPRQQSESGRNNFDQHASSMPTESESVLYEHSARWSRHKISSLTSGAARDQEQNSVESEPQPRDVPSPQTSSQQAKPASSVFKSRRFDPTRDECEEVEQLVQPGSRLQPVVKAAEPAVLVIPKRHSMLSGPVMTQLLTSVATKRTANLVVMPSIQPPMSVTLSIGGRRKPNSSTSVSSTDSQTEQESSRKRARTSFPVVSTLRRDGDQAQQAQGPNESGPGSGATRSFATKDLHSETSVADTEMVDVSSGRTSVKRPRAAAASAPANVTPPQKATPPRGRKLRAKLVAKPKGGEGTDEQAGLSLLVLASSERK